MTIVTPPGEAPPREPEGIRPAAEAAGLDPTQSALQLQTYRLQTLNRIARAISADLEIERIVQTVTDAATDLAGARFGAFFYNAIGETGEGYVLHALSGAPHGAFAGFELPRKTELFAPTFDGTGIVRSDDVRQDPRYGASGPYFGMPDGHLPVVSYLAVPVVSRTGEVHGGLFFGHDQPGMFPAELEELMAAVASHAAIALDNARLLQAAKVEALRHRQAHEAAWRLAAIVESSDDAIVSKNLDGIIVSWNKGAERLFGYTVEEAVGRPITMLIPDDRQAEEPVILDRIRKGERIEHYETIRRRKDGTLLDISLTVSPVRDQDGVIIGASKIARDITDRRRAEHQQALLLREMNHRVKNLFALAMGVVALSARSAESPAVLAAAIRERLSALARAHDLTLPDLRTGEAKPAKSTTLKALLATILAPYMVAGQERIRVEGTDVPIGGGTLTSLALLFHELATNSAKYGSLSALDGSLRIGLATGEGELRLDWIETGGPKPGLPATQGFGSQLEQGILEGHLRGRIEREWRQEGLAIRLTLPLDRLA